MTEQYANHKKICEDIHELYVRKNHDYGDSFTKLYDKYGMTYVMMHLEEKIMRADTLLSKKEALVNDESIEDTLMDLANYSIMTLNKRMMDRSNNEA